MKKENNTEITRGRWDFYWDAEKSPQLINFSDNMIYLWFETSGFFTKHLKNFIEKNKRYSFIELGCGGGNFLPYFKKRYRNFEIYGVDNSKIGCEQARKRLNLNSFEKRIIYGNIMNNPISKKFDIVMSFGLIEHFDRPETALKKHVDLLKKDGVLLCVIPNLLGLQGKMFTSNDWFLKEDKQEPVGFMLGIKKITIESLNKWSKNLGLKNRKILPVGGFLPMFIIESLRPKKKSKLKIVLLIHRYLLLWAFFLINIPLLFRVNSLNFSPYIILVGKK